MQLEWIEVFTAPDALAANSVLALLAEAGLSPRLIQQSSGLADYIIGSALVVSWGRIEVPADEAEKALELIGGFLGTMGMLEEASGEDSEREDSLGGPSQPGIEI